MIRPGCEAHALACGHTQALGPAVRKLYVRQAEVFGAYTAYNDHEIGRSIQAFDDLDKLDTTLVIYINGDNGTSAEVDLRARLLSRVLQWREKWYDVWGTEQTCTHMSAGWSWAFDTPFD